MGFEGIPSSSSEGSEEKPKIFEDPKEDPGIRDFEKNILRLTNKAVTEAQSGESGEIAKEDSSGTKYENYWHRENKRVDIQQWDSFVRRNPEKAEAYREKHPMIAEALDRAERRNSS